jgi:hypothetical protein
VRAFGRRRVEDSAGDTARGASDGIATSRKQVNLPLQDLNLALEGVKLGRDLVDDGFNRASRKSIVDKDELGPR